jgi:Na+/H+-translocating membrane pyrophosphatase
MAKRKRTYKDEKEIVRRTLVVIALALFMYATSVSSPGVLARDAVSMVGSGAVGMYAGVESNPYNTAAAQLAAKQNELQARESLVDARSGGSLTGTRVLAAASFCISLLVLVLVSLNYYMDFRRGRRVIA